jgi:thiol-disulfide isomerase/thioredoxin
MKPLHMLGMSQLFASVAFAGCLIFCISCQTGCGEKQPPDSETAMPNPNTIATKPTAENADTVHLKILDYAGLQRLIASHRGDVVVMDAWSTACPPCVHDFPRFVKLSKRYRERGLACISLSFDYEGIGRPEDEAPRVLDFLRKQNADFDNVLASEEADTMYKKLGIPSVPEVFVYDRNGKLVARLQEAAENSKEKPLYDRVEDLVAKLLAAH